MLLLLGSGVCPIFSAEAQSLYFKNYGLAQGLPSSSVMKVAQDSVGNIWIATSGGGISKFDSETFTNYSIADGLPNSMVYDLVPKHQKVYIATPSGLSIYDGKKFTNIRVDENYALNSVSLLHVDEQARVWMAGSYNGLKVLEKNKIIHYSFPLEPEEARVQSFASSAAGALYIGFDTGSLYVHSNGRFKKLKQFDKALSSLLYTSDSSLWVSTSRELYLLKQNNWRLIDTHNTYMLVMAEGKDHHVWVNDGRQLYTIRVLPDTIEKTEYKDQPVPDADIVGLFIDKDQNLWLNSYLNGLYLGYSTPFRPHQNQELMRSFVFGIQQDSRDNIFYSTLTDGLLLENPDGKIENVTARYNIPTNTLLSSLIDRQDRLWISTNTHGIICMDGGKTTIITTIGGKTSKYGRILGQDSSGNIWHYNTHGLHRWDGTQYTTFTTEDGLYSHRVLTFCELKSGEILFGTAGGVNLYQEGTITPFLPEHFEQKEISKIVEDSWGNLWFAIMGEGLRYYAQASGRAFSPNRMKSYSQQDGLLSDMIFTLFQDKSGNIWAGTGRGINKLKIDREGIQSIKSFGEPQGFAGKLTNPNTFLLRDHEIYFGSGLGVYVYDSLHIAKSSKVQPYLTDVSIDNQHRKWAAQTSTLSPWTNVPATLSFESGAYPISFKFNAIAYNNKEELLYTYTLTGHDQEWSVPSPSGVATYPNLSPGLYTLRIKAGTKDNIQLAIPNSYTFRVNAAYYQTGWFALLCLVVLIVLVYITDRIMTRYRIRKALALEAFKSKERDAIRQALARDFHDEIGNLIASISTYTNVLQLKLKDAPDDIQKSLYKIEAASRTLYSGTKDFIWSIDRSNDELVEIFFHLKDYGDQFFLPCGIDFMAENLLKEGQKIPLVQGASRHVTRIFKEMMTNVIKHAGATEVHFTLDYDHVIKAWVLTFRDNGKGLSIMDPGGYGLKNIRKRADMIGAEIDFIAQDKGLAFRLKIDDGDTPSLASTQASGSRSSMTGNNTGLWSRLSRFTLNGERPK
ncbi:signal transduction histidine kinase [Flammeovirgaceae bacterium 311]|nr:signal transduction histidine kinase [Flammeovirgaceae bacterium 311]